MKTQFPDEYPNYLKTDIPVEIFKLLGISSEPDKDFCIDKESGGGGTVTKYAWSKILRRVEELSTVYDLRKQYPRAS